MKDYEKHIRHTHAEKVGTAWCGARLQAFDWTFMDIDHAVYSVQRGSTSLPCPACVSAAVGAFASGVTVTGCSFRPIDTAEMRAELEQARKVIEAARGLLQKRHGRAPLDMALAEYDKGFV